MVVVVASDALLDSPGRLFWPIEPWMYDLGTPHRTASILQHPSLHVAVPYL